MENICIRLDSALAKQIEKDMQEFKYSTKTEFIRDAIRSKLKALNAERNKEKAWQHLFTLKGALKGKSRFKTDEEFHAWRSDPKTGEELMAYLEKNV